MVGFICGVLVMYSIFATVAVSGYRERALKAEEELEKWKRNNSTM